MGARARRKCALSSSKCVLRPHQLSPVRDFPRNSRRDLDRLIVVAPRKDNAVSYLVSIFTAAGRQTPAALEDWERRVDAWCSSCRDNHGPCALVEVNLGTAVFVFDRTHERVVGAYGVATEPAGERDRNRMRRFPDVNMSIRATMDGEAFDADGGHFLSHAAGGELDINLFPQRRELNRGWSAEGKLFRRMEAYTARHPGVFHFHRPVYDDLSWIPSSLEYGVLREDNEWWVERFRNK